MNLRDELIKRKISPSDFARVMGVTPAWVSQLLMGKKKAGPALQARIDAFLSVCWVCGQKWPEGKS